MTVNGIIAKIIENPTEQIKVMFRGRRTAEQDHTAKGGFYLTMRQKNKLWLVMAASLFLVAMGAGGLLWLSQQLPDSFTVVRGEELDLSAMGLSAERIGGDGAAEVNGARETETGYQAQVSLFHLIPIKTVDVSVVDDLSVIPCGTPFGIKLFTNGVVVVGVADISTEDGSRNPAKEGGVQMGDIITAIDGTPVTETEMVSDAMTDSNGEPVTLTVDRDGVEKTVTVRPVRSSYDGKYKGGIWVRDSTAGIGIVTFYRPGTGMFGGLGHGICDVDTNDLMPLRTGEIVPVCISGVIKGRQGNAGELKGYFTSDNVMGRLYSNTETGVYGQLDDPPVEQSPVAVAMKQDVRKGDARILTTVDGETPEFYDVEIELLDLRDESQVKNMVIHITDPALLEKTGGIVQGMSGSPILQDGKLVGAVTHVFVNDPERGYGIFAENMVQASKNVTDSLENQHPAA